MSVPISTTDWCISALTFSARISFPSSSICWIWDFNSRDCGSTIWNSSSTPSVKQSCFCHSYSSFLFQRFTVCKRCNKCTPGKIILFCLVIFSSSDSHISGSFDNPLKIFFSHRIYISIGCRITKINCIRNPISNSKFNSIKIITNALLRARTPLLTLSNIFFKWFWISYITKMMRLPWIILHNVNILSIQTIAAKYSVKIISSWSIITSCPVSL